ncbi:3-mercaptopyruvate sulfurtransferase [Pelomyxa schiedti]|nr:3-mercaptopyruvate sulfurtransferase [Pelomyxa schiedti]
MSQDQHHQQPQPGAATSTYVGATEVAGHLGDAGWVVVDARFALGDAGKGRADYEASHVRGAAYLHLNEDASDPVVKGLTGRHPLPSPDRANMAFSRAGIRPGVTVVVYDDMGGALAAARVWWLLKWLQHDAPVYVLNGGWQNWVKQGLPTSTGPETSRVMGNFVGRPRNDMAVTVEDVDRIRRDAGWRLIDVRNPERFQGKNETIDPVAGHIPGAINVPFVQNNGPDGLVLSPQELRTKYSALLTYSSTGTTIPPERVVFYCGSGVTGALGVLAMTHSGLGMPKLYPGSWSHWITDSSRPIATTE